MDYDSEYNTTMKVQKCNNMARELYTLVMEMHESNNHVLEQSILQQAQVYDALSICFGWVNAAYGREAADAMNRMVNSVLSEGHDNHNLLAPFLEENNE